MSARAAACSRAACSRASAMIRSGSRRLGLALARAELLLEIARGARRAAVAEPLADELQVAVDLLGVIAPANAAEAALDHEQRSGVTAGRHPTGVRARGRESCAAA